MKKIKQFFKGLKKEFKMIRWPSGKNLAKYSIITILMIVFFGLFFYFLDAIFALLRSMR